MSNQDTKRLAAARALQSAFRTEALIEMPSNDDVSAMLIANGENPDAIAQQYQDLIEAKIRAAKKTRMQGFRRTSIPSVGFSLRAAVVSDPALPNPEIMRKRIESLSSSPEFDKSGLAIAYRNGTKQSDSDIISLYQDLMELGVIENDFD